MNSLKILLLSCYELGHQPLSLAWPLALLLQAGHKVSAVDLSVDPLDTHAASQADFVGISVPMHTALRLGVQAARQVRALNPGVHICFYGLYAGLNADYLLSESATDGRPRADSVISGEYEAPLLDLVKAVAEGKAVSHVPGISTTDQRAPSHLKRLSFPVPNRSLLPPLERYARYMHEGQAKVVGYVEATRGCLHTCRHCPVVPVYQGRFFVVPVETVLADIRQQVAMGARHITFGDPDFLNGPGHALKVARALHSEFPQVTFDITTKVEHILERRDLLPELQESGARSVVSAFESVSNRVLSRLHKGHVRADMDEALVILEGAGLAVQPTWVAFTPWTTLDDYLEMLAWIRERGLIRHVPAVQLAIRLLIPPGSGVLEENQNASWLGPLDRENFTYQWHHPDPCMDVLHRELSRLVEQTAGDDSYATFASIERLAYEIAGQLPPHWERPLSPELPPPRLTEDWFC